MIWDWSWGTGVGELELGLAFEGLERTGDVGIQFRLETPRNPCLTSGFISLR